MIHTTSASARAAPRYRVLHVDDDDDALELIDDLLGEDVELLSCAHPDLVVQAAREFRPDVFLIDLKLGQRDGLALVDELQALGEFDKSPVIMLSAIDSAENKARCFSGGACDYLVKFPDPLELLARVRYHAQVNRRRRDLQHLQREVLERKHALEADLRFAAQVQHEMLAKPLRSACFDSAVLNRPCGLVSGDFYHFEEQVDGGCAIFLGDATGHGIAAAFITIMASMGLAQVRQSMMTSEVLRQLDAVLSPAIPGGHFMTGMAVHIAIDGQLRLSAGGHPPLLIVAADSGEISSLRSGGLPMGIPVRDKHYAMLHHQLAPGDKVFLYTDGVLERENAAGEHYGAERLHAFLAEHRGQPIAALVAALGDAIEEFAGGVENGDDMTLIGVEYRDGGLIA